MGVQTISRELEQNKKALKEEVGLETSFDLIAKDFEIGRKSAFLFSVNGFVKDEVLADIMSRLSYVEREQIVPRTLKSILTKFIPHIQSEEVEDLHKLIIMVLSGGTALFIEGETSAIVIDVKSFPVRSIAEPDLEKVVRGSRDGFNETLLTNISLVRRRIRDPQLRFELFKIGTRSETDVSIGYNLFNRIIGPISKHGFIHRFI